VGLGLNVPDPVPPQVKLDPVNNQIWRDVHRRDKNKLVFVCGETGDCKSGSAITKCWELDRGAGNKPRFYVSDDPDDPKNRVVTSAEGFIRLIKTKLPTGSCIIWDEIGVDADNREYYTLKNRLVKKVFQTFRYKNLIVFMTVPDFNSVDIGVRKLAHGYMEMKGQVRGGTMARGRWQWISTNPKTGKIYYIYPRWITPDGEKCKLIHYYVNRPPADIEERYKRLKDRVNERWYNDFESQIKFMNKFTGVGATREMSLVDLKDEVIKNPLEYWNDYKEKFIDVLLEAKLGLNTSRAKSLAKYLNAEYEAGNLPAEAMPHRDDVKITRKHKE